MKNQPKNSSLTVKPEILHFSFRYALGRSSYAPSSVMEAIKDNVEHLDTQNLMFFVKEINEATDYGMEMDKLSWLDFRDYLNKIIEHRKVEIK